MGTFSEDPWASMTGIGNGCPTTTDSKCLSSGFRSSRVSTDELDRPVLVGDGGRSDPSLMQCLSS